MIRAAFALALLASPALAADCGLYGYRAVITEVYDGDTVTADIDLGFSTWRHGERLRLLGIDAPEMRGPERQKGIASRDALRSRILGKTVTLCTVQARDGADMQEKFGRYLARIYLDGVVPAQHNVNAWMVMRGHAKPYWP